MRQQPVPAHPAGVRDEPSVQLVSPIGVLVRPCPLAGGRQPIKREEKKRYKKEEEEERRKREVYGFGTKMHVMPTAQANCAGPAQSGLPMASVWQVHALLSQLCTASKPVQVSCHLRRVPLMCCSAGA